MYTAAIAVIFVICILLILVVLIQNAKGSGVSEAFSAGSNLIGVKRTGDLLENVTWGLAIALLVGCLSTNFLFDRDGTGQVEINSPNVERAQESGFAPAQPQPTQEQPQQQGQ
ncbi:MAG: preprotein translocase subunit SecG [Cytophagales bacterium]|nr:preprotein translocase subunit SecG [Cytophagales bacterium]